MIIALLNINIYSINIYNLGHSLEVEDKDGNFLRAMKNDISNKPFHCNNIS